MTIVLLYGRLAVHASRWQACLDLWPRKHLWRFGVLPYRKNNVRHGFIVVLGRIAWHSIDGWRRR